MPTFGHVNGLHVDDAIIDHKHERGTGKLRLELQDGGVADGIGLFVERHLERVGREPTPASGLA